MWWVTFFYVFVALKCFQKINTLKNFSVGEKQKQFSVSWPHGQLGHPTHCPFSE